MIVNPLKISVALLSKLVKDRHQSLVPPAIKTQANDSLLARGGLVCDNSGFEPDTLLHRARDAVYI